jgi:predicted nucleotidyltransferase
MATLLQKLDSERRDRRESLRNETRKRLRIALKEILPAPTVIVFGSITKPGRFSESSDVDVALEREPEKMSIYQLTAQLSERLGRPVDVVILSQCRFRDRIFREGETWTLLA